MIPKKCTPFVVVTSPRTGSTLLMQMLDAHPAIVAGGELFNAELVAAERIDWPDPDVPADRTWNTLRQENPVAFISRLRDRAEASGAEVVGFKLLYEQALESSPPALLEYLVGETSIRVIHLRRRNVLRQFLSLKRAAISGEWHRVAGQQGAPRPAVGPVTLDLAEMVWFFRRTYNRSRKFDDLFKDHPLVHVDYEAMSEDPQGAVRRLQSFLGVEPRDVEIKYRRTGVDDLRRGIANFDELKSLFEQWGAFFDQ